MGTRALVLDVSNNQGSIDWGRVAGSVAVLEGMPVGVVEGSMLKASEGTHFVDRYVEANQQQAKHYGLAVGYYHFMRADLGNSGEAEADFMWSVIRDLVGPGDTIALDVEDYPGIPQPPDLRDFCNQFVGRMGYLAGFPPMIYSTSSYLQAHNCTGNPVLSEHGLWMASWYHYPPPATFPKPPPNWPFVALWQYTSSGRVDGINGNVDLNYFNGTIDQFRAYGQPSEEIAAEPPPRAYLDNLWLAEEQCVPVYTSAADQADLEAIRRRAVAIKNRYGYQP